MDPLQITARRVGDDVLVPMDVWDDLITRALLAEGSADTCDDSNAPLLERVASTLHNACHDRHSWRVCRHELCVAVQRAQKGLWW